MCLISVCVCVWAWALCSCGSVSISTLIQFSLKLCTLVADTTFSLKLLQVSTHLCKKLNFLTSLRHLSFLSFLLCNLVLLMSYSSFRISFSLST
ncbi:hypothetical protein E2C01_048347 [Portunus trituberculatus]|uniref:Secreted protein n=1 Tax=Portunus trituberculatus TaxID=210409 RepID=A0A5B7G3K2_PORTR|nr:hypothetical protein [Portunus trituberculatus]